MDPNTPQEQVQGNAVDTGVHANHVDSLPGLTAPVHDVDFPEQRLDQPVEELLPTLAGTLVPEPVVADVTRPQRLVWLRNLLGNPRARIGIGIVGFFILVAIFAPVIAPGDPQEFVDSPNLPPSAQHIFGTEGQGKDVFRQTVWGAQISLTIGFGTAILVTIISVTIGMSAGYFRGRVDDLLSLLMNLFLVIPALPLLIVISGYLKPSTGTVVVVLAFTGWAFGARVKRAQTLTLREKDFVAAAQVSGQSHFGIIFHQILPNMTSLIVGSAVGAVTAAILASTALAFLGLTNVSDVTWGTNLYWAQNNSALLVGAWWTFIPSGMCVGLVAFGLALINYGMDEVTNPRLRAEREVRNVITSKRTRVRATPFVPDLD
jgi:peptide/nickel transport system permease protein